MQLTFNEYLDEIRPICCYFKLNNDSMQSIHDIIANRLTTDLPTIWLSLKSGFTSFQHLPTKVCREFWLIEALVSQLAPFPFCHDKKHFVIFQNWFLGFFVSSGAIAGWWKQISYTPLPNTNPFESPFFMYTAPCVFQAQLEIFGRLCLYYFWPKFPSVVEHIIIILTRYETAISLLFNISITRLFLKTFLIFCASWAMEWLS